MTTASPQISAISPPASCPESGLDETVRGALNDARGSWPSIGGDKASGVSHSWISKFVRRQIPNPGYRTLKDLHAYLASRGMVRKVTQRTRKAKG